MSRREEALAAFQEHFAFKDNPIAWSAWKMAWDLAYCQAIDDAVKNLGRAYYVRDKIRQLKIK